jgi:hypothetical protein
MFALSKSPKDAAERLLTPSRPPSENIHWRHGLSMDQSQIGVWWFTIFAQIAGTSLARRGPGSRPY